MIARPGKGRVGVAFNAAELYDRIHKVTPCNRSHVGGLLREGTQRLSQDEGWQEKDRWGEGNRSFYNVTQHTHMERTSSSGDSCTCVESWQLVMICILVAMSLGLVIEVLDC